MSSDLALIDRWIYERLAASPAVTSLVGGTASPRIFASQATQGAALPLVIYDVDDGRHEAGVKGDSGCITADYVVRGVTAADGWASAAALAEAIDGALHQAAGTVIIGGTAVLAVGGCVRTNNVRYLEFDAGKRYNHMGAAYRIWASRP